MDLFSAELLHLLRDIAVILGVVYAPILFANGIMDIVIKFRNLRNDNS